VEFIDTHAHLDIQDFQGEVGSIIRHARNSEVVGIINVGYDIPSSLSSIKLARNNDDIFATVGVHPHDAKNWDEEKSTRIADLAKADKVVAIGEIGLDYYRNLSEPNDQIKCFRDQLEIAVSGGHRIIIHCREAWSEVVRILDEYDLKHLVLHSFSGDPMIARWAFERGYYLSFNGSITYPRNQTIHGIISNMPKDLMLLETDCPYLSPVPLRGKRNEPAYIRHTATKMGNILGSSIGEVSKLTTKNARKFFDI